MLHPSATNRRSYVVAAMSAILVILLTFPASGQDGPKEFAPDFFRPLKGAAEDSKEFVLTGPEAAKCVKFEPEGLRVTLPTGHVGERPNTGVALDLGFKGDFEVTLGYEVLHEPEPEETGKDGTRLTLGLTLQGKAARNRCISPEKWAPPQGICSSHGPNVKTTSARNNQFQGPSSARRRPAGSAWRERGPT